jgi:hypothetical protein
MATKRISALTAAGSAALTDQIPIEAASNATRKLTLTQVFALAASQTWSWSGTHAFGAAVTMATTLGVTGAVTLASTLSAGASTLASLDVTGAATVGTTLGVTGAATLSSTLAVTGLVTLATLPRWSTLTPGSIPFGAASGQLSQDNAALFWDAANDRLGVGTTTPARTLDVVGTFGATGASTLTGLTQIGASAQTYVTAGNCNLSSRLDFTNTSGSAAAIAGHTNPAPGSASTAEYHGVCGYINNSNANTSGATLWGGAFDARSSAAIAAINGALARGQSSRASGTTASALGIYASAENTGAGTVTSATAVNALGVNSGGGTIGTFYGVRVPVSATLATTTWGIFVDSANSYFGGDVHIGVAGKGLRVKEGSNAKMGVATLVAGVATVANTSVTATSRIFLTGQSGGGTPGALRVSARVNGTSFTITSSSGADTSVVAWQIFEPA